MSQIYFQMYVKFKKINNIIVTEFPNINKIYFDNNERLDDDELRIIASELKLKNYNDLSINTLLMNSKKFINLWLQQCYNRIFRKNI